MATYWKLPDGSTGGIEAVPLDNLPDSEADGTPLDEVPHKPEKATVITKADWLALQGKPAEQPAPAPTGGSTSGSLAPIVFGKLINAAGEPGAITKSGVSLTALDAGGWAIKSALTDGAISIPANNLIHYAFGWLPEANVADAIVDWKKLAHCVYFYGNGYSVYEFGASKFSGAFAVNDLFLVTLIGTTVMYTQNNKMVFTSVRNKTGLLSAVLVKTPGVKLVNINHFIKE